MQSIFQLHDVQMHQQGFALFGRTADDQDVAVFLSEEQVAASQYFYIRRTDGNDTESERESFVRLLNEKLLAKARVFQKMVFCQDPCCGNTSGCKHDPLTMNSNAASSFGPMLENFYCKKKINEMLVDSQAKPLAWIEDSLNCKTNILAKSMVGYSPEPQSFVKIRVRNYSVMKWIKALITDHWRKALETSSLVAGWEFFELHLDPIVKFMAYYDLVGGGMVEVLGLRQLPRASQENISRCALELHFPTTWGRTMNIETKTNYPMRVASFDIECISFTKGKFPKADEGDPIIQIGLVLETLFVASETPRQEKFVLCLDQVDPIDDGQVLCYPTEKELLEAFFAMVIENERPDVLAGYNSSGFDLPYILTRARELGLEQYRYFSKLRQPYKFWHWDYVFKSNQSGARALTLYNTPGMVQFDLFQYLKKTMTLQSYALKEVSKVLLPGGKENEKEDMKYSDLAPYQLEGPSKRALIAKYCLQDTVLVSKLMAVQKIIVQAVEFSKLCGVLMDHRFQKGVTFQILRKLMQYTKREGFLIPSFRSDEFTGNKIVPYYDEIDNPLAEYEDDDDDDNDDSAAKVSGKKRQRTLIDNDTHSTDHGGGVPSGAPAGKPKGEVVRGTMQRQRNLKFQGAFVLDPIKGLHEDVVITLDFASLYPSEMRAKNLCTSTLLKSAAHARALGLRDDEFEVVASGFTFVTKKRFEGILPLIQTELAAERKRAKGELRKAVESGDEMLVSVLDGVQLSVKLIMNSLYGFCGSRVASLSALPVAISVTAEGRHDLLRTKNWVETHYRKLFPEAEQLAQVIYGDTDSVFVKLNGVRSLEEAARRGFEIEKRINSTAVVEGLAGLFDSPLVLEFEKLYKTLYLLGKKRYVGYKYAADDISKGKLDYKGLEVARRDSSALTRNTMKGFIDRLVVQSNRARAIEYVRSRVADLMSGKVPLEEIILSKKLVKWNYATPQPHCEVARILKELDPMSAPDIGDRVEFVIMNDKIQDKTSLRARPVEWFKNGRCTPDHQYYLDKHLAGPMIRLIEPLLGEKKTKPLFEARLSREMQNSAKKNGFAKLFRLT